MVTWVDTHNHLYADDFSDDLREVVQRSLDAGVTRILLPNIDRESAPKMFQICKQFPAVLHPMMGLHPCDVKEDFKEVLEALYPYIHQEGIVGVGEVGMDLHWDVSTKEWQKEALQVQILWAIEKDLPLSLHTRNATHEVIQILKPFKGKVRGVFHCFSESLELAHEILKLGFYLGIGGVVTFKKAGIREVISQIGVENLVLETDSPYLAPTPHRGKRNEPSYIRLISDEIASLTGKSTLEIGEITTRNAQELFKI